MNFCLKHRYSYKYCLLSLMLCSSLILERRLPWQGSSLTSARRRCSSKVCSLPARGLRCQPWPLALGWGANLPQWEVCRLDHNMWIWLCFGQDGMSWVHQWLRWTGTTQDHQEQQWLCHEGCKVWDQHCRLPVPGQAVHLHPKAKCSLPWSCIHSSATETILTAQDAKLKDFNST